MSKEKIMNQIERDLVEVFRSADFSNPKNEVNIVLKEPIEHIYFSITI